MAQIFFIFLPQTWNRTDCIFLANLKCSSRKSRKTGSDLPCFRVKQLYMSITRTYLNKIRLIKKKQYDRWQWSCQCYHIELWEHHFLLCRNAFWTWFCTCLGTFRRTWNKNSKDIFKRAFWLNRNIFNLRELILRSLFFIFLIEPRGRINLLGLEFWNLKKGPGVFF